MDAHKSLKKLSEFDKCSSWSLFSEMKIICMSIDCFMFWMSTVMPLFSVLLLWHTFAHSHTNSGSKRTHSWLNNGYTFLKNVLLKLNFKDEGHLYGNCLFYILSFCLTFLLFLFFSCCIRMHIPILTKVKKGHISG